MMPLQLIAPTALLIPALALLLLAFAPGTAAAQTTVCEAQTGQAALQCIQDHFTPTATLGYGPARDVMYSEIDSDASGQLEGIYSGYTITLDPGDDPSQDAYSKGINAEHVFPQSQGAGNEPQRSDIHNLYPAHAPVNSARSNTPFGESPDAQTDTWYYLSQTRGAPPSSNIDAYSERLGSSAWEPRESKKGDIARAVFYFYAVYTNAANDAFFEGMIDQLLDWHASDPVTQSERDRSTAIAAEQGNENPFVLDATLASRTFGTASSGPTLVFDPATLTAGEGTAATLTVRYHNPDGHAVDVDVVFQSGSSTAASNDLDGFSAQTVSFPASASGGATRTVSLTITDDNDAEGSEEALFQLANLSTSGSAEAGTDNTAILSITDNENPLVINEVLADPATGPEGDANQDNARSATEDEFIEIYNTSTTATVDLSGYEYIDDGVGLRHVFPEGSTLPPEAALVVFGGGTPAGSIPGVVQTASTGTLALNNGGDSFTIVDEAGNAVLTYNYDGSVDDQSMTRDPDFTGPFVPHSAASGSGGALFSPGRSVGSTPLPVELVAFTARHARRGVQLIWSTASETNNAGFEVQRRGQHDTWTTLGFIGGAGTTQTEHTYRYTDTALPFEAEALTYRLRQIDTDGSVHLSDAITVQRDPASRLALHPIFPNPASGPVTLRYTLPSGINGAVHIELVDVLGRRVRRISHHPGPSNDQRHELQFNPRGLPSGTYFVRIRADGQARTRSITIVR